VAGERFEIRFVDKRRGREIQQPRGDYAASSPEFRNLRKIEGVLIVFRIPQGRRLGVERTLARSGVGVPEDVELSVSETRYPFHPLMLRMVLNSLEE
jgi:hypothetical protein